MAILLCSCRVRPVPEINTAGFVDYASRGGSYSVRLVTFLKPDSAIFVYIENGDSVIYDLRKRSIASTLNRKEHVDSFHRKNFLINDKYYPVERWETGLYTRDGSAYYFLSKDFGLLGIKSGSWNSFTRLYEIRNMTDPLPLLLTDLAFAAGDW